MRTAKENSSVVGEARESVEGMHEVNSADILFDSHPCKFVLSSRYRRVPLPIDNNSGTFERKRSWHLEDPRALGGAYYDR